MKYLTLILIIVFFASGNVTFAQKKGKKAETWQISDSYRHWTFCKTNGVIDDACIEKMSITFENSSDYHVSNISVMLKIINPSGTVLYKKKHTLSIDLDPGEKAPCREFYLKEKVMDSQYGFSDSDSVANNIKIEIISVN